MERKIDIVFSDSCWLMMMGLMMLFLMVWMVMNVRDGLKIVSLVLKVLMLVNSSSVISVIGLR